MANDRLYMRCTGCHQHILLYKYYPGSGYVVHEREELDDFMKDHIEICQMIYSGNLEGVSPFYLMPESDPDFRDGILRGEE